MNTEDDLRGLAKVADFMRTISILFAILNIYYYCYPCFYPNTIEVIDKILLNFQNTTGLFSCILYTKLFTLLFLSLSCLGIRTVKSDKITLPKIYLLAISGFILFFGNWWLLLLPLPLETNTLLYIVTMVVGYLCLLGAGTRCSRYWKNGLLKDPFNRANESFMQETVKIENQYSINLPTKFWFRGKEYRGWVNMVNPFRASVILGTPGSGKSYAIINNFLKQMIEKGYCLYVYDYKYPDLSEIVYNHLRTHLEGYKIKPKFYVINIDNPCFSHRCNPIAPHLLPDIADAYESAFIVMLNLNRSWITKQGDFFVESPIVFLASIIWFLKIYKGGKYCTFPHVLEFINQKYTDIFTIFSTYPELQNYIAPFLDAWQGGASEQLQGQIASAKIPLSRLTSPRIYWIMSGDDFSLDLNNANEPKILCVANNPDRQNIYSAALSLYNSRIIKLMNRKGQEKSGIVVDELSTLYFRGLDNTIATARSNRVAVCLAFQDLSQLTRDYGDKEAKAIFNTVGNVLSGQVVAETAKDLSERFGKIVQERRSVTKGSDTSDSVNTQLDNLIPPSVISNLSQGYFVGSVADNYDSKIEQKIFHAEITVDNERVKQETAEYQKIPVITNFTGADGIDRMEEEIQRNYKQIKTDVKEIIKNELIRIQHDPQWQHLVKPKDK